MKTVKGDQVLGEDWHIVAQRPRQVDAQIAERQNEFFEISANRMKVPGRDFLRPRPVVRVSHALFEALTGRVRVLLAQLCYFFTSSIQLGRAAHRYNIGGIQANDLNHLGIRRTFTNHRPA